MDSNKKELTSVTNKLKYIIKLLNERDFSAAGVRVTALKTVVDELKENKVIDDKSWLFFESLISLMSCLYQLGSGVRKLEDLDTDEVIGFLLQTCFPFEGICKEKYLYFFIVVAGNLIE